MRRSTLLALAGASVLALMADAGNAPANEAKPFSIARPAVETSQTPATDKIGAKVKPIGANQTDLFFGGEFASRTIPFFVPPTEAAGTVTLVLAMETAISVAPESSRMTVKINGQDIGATGLAAGNPKRVQFSVPPGIIQPGYNALTLMADQRHRVDCSIDATYELWTRIDSANSGLIYSATNRGAQALVDLLPQSGTMDGRTSIRVVLPQGVSMEHHDRAMQLVQALSILGDFQHPAVSFGDRPGTGPGIDIHLGTREELARSLGERAATLSTGELTVVESAGGERQRLIVVADDVGALETKLDEIRALAARERPAGSAEGLEALTNRKGRMLRPGDRISLGTLGFTAKRFSGRHMVSQINFTMPPDFYPGDYSGIDLHLNALYVGGLSKNATLVVKANAKEVANISLSAPRSGEIRDQRLPIPFSVLKPGQNTLQLEARVPTERDGVCETVEETSKTVRLLITENSYLEVPDYARIGRYPDIAVLSSGMAMAASGDLAKPVYHFVPNFDPDTLNASASFIAKMAYASGVVQNARFVSVLPAETDSNLIAFGSFDTLPSELTSRLNIDFANIRDAEAGLADPDAAEAERAEAEAAEAVFRPAAATPEDLAGLQLATAAGEDAATNPQSLELGEDGLIKTVTDRSKEWSYWGLTELAKDIDAIRARYADPLFDQRQVTVYTPPAEATMVVAQESLGPGGVWTIVAAKSKNDMVASVDMLTSDKVWNTLGGSIQSFSEAGRMVDRSFSGTETLYATQPLSFTNARLVTAGWLANNAEIYALSLVIAAMLLGVGTFMVLRFGGSRHD